MNSESTTTLKNHTCKKCHKTKPIGDFAIKKDGKHKLTCIVCLEKIKNNTRFRAIKKCGYTTDQTSAIITIEDLLKTQDLVLLSGPAGAGKTEVLKYFSGVRTMFLTPTHKAKSVLQSRIELLGEVETFHKFFGGEEQYDENGNSKWVFNFKSSASKIKKYNLIIIDEVSMLAEDQYNVIIECIKLFRVKFLTSGDDCQLPPVKDFDKNKKQYRKCSILYDKHPVDVELTRNIRNENSEYNELLTQLRECIKSKMYDNKTRNKIESSMIRYLNSYSSNVPVFKNVEWNKHRIVIDTINKFCNEYSDDTSCEGPIVLAHRTNDRLNVVKMLNDLIRDIRFNHPTEAFCAEELIQFTGYYTDNEKVYYTCDRSVVKIVSYAYREFFEKSFQCYELKLEDDTTIYYPVESSLLKFKRYANEIKQQIKQSIKNKTQKEITSEWRGYYQAFKSVKAPIEYRYSMSIHKSQGSSYKHAYIFLSDFFWMSRKNENIDTYYKLLYVALSRSKTNSHVF